MTLTQPGTPPSPSQTSYHQLPAKPISSPSINHSLLTPAHSVSGSMSSITAPDLLPLGDESTHKRKRSIDDQGEREQKKVHIEDSRLTIDDLHLDVGSKYQLCRTPHIRVSPDPASDFFARFSLTDIAAGVAREFPNGEKNPIRKTYKGHMKLLGIAGRFDVTRKELGEPDTLHAMITKPQDYWQMELSAATNIELGFSESVLAGLTKAATMARGPLRKDQWDSSVLGEVGKSAAAAAPSVAATPKMGTTVNKVASVNPAVARAIKADGVRAKRNIRKRSYADSSFEGYNETYADDAREDCDYSTPDVDERGARKKSKKASISMPPQHQYSYGPGMVGA